jgi:hypothetical protein
MATTFSSMAADADGTIYYLDEGSRRIILVNPTTGIASEIVPPTATDWGASRPIVVTVDALRRPIIRRSSAAGLPIFRQDPVSRQVTQLPTPVQARFLATDADNNIWYQDFTFFGTPIRKVDAVSGQVVSEVGALFSGGIFVPGDGGLASQANLGRVYGMVFDSEGSMYFVDSAGAPPPPGAAAPTTATIRKVTNPGTASAIITRFAGGGTSQADGIPALQRSIPFAAGLAIDAGDNLYVVETTAQIGEPGTPTTARVLIVDRATGTITRIAGAAVLGGAPSPFLSTTAQPANGVALPYINSIDTDSKGNVYIASGASGTVWKLECSV